MIWKQGSCEQELFEGMKIAEQKAIVAEDSSKQSLIIQAMEALNSAAQSFERSGRISRAKEITTVMVSLANSDVNEAKDKKPKSSKEEAKKVFMFFGFGPEDLKGLDFSSDGEVGSDE